MSTRQPSRNGTWEPERLWWLLDTVDVFRGLRWTLQRSEWSGTMTARGRGWDAEIHGQAFRLRRPRRHGISVNDGLSDQAVAFSEPVHRAEGGELTVRDRRFVFEAHSGDAWQPGELTPRPGHRVLDDSGGEILSIRSGTLKPTFEFELGHDLDDHVAFPLLALATALAVRLRATGRRARGMSPYV